MRNCTTRLSRARRWLLGKVLGKDNTFELLMCLRGSRYCLTHDAAKETIAFEVKHLDNMIDVLG